MPLGVLNGSQVMSTNFIGRHPDNDKWLPLSLSVLTPVYVNLYSRLYGHWEQTLPNVVNTKLSPTFKLPRAILEIITERKVYVNPEIPDVVWLSCTGEEFSDGLLMSPDVNLDSVDDDDNNVDDNELLAQEPSKYVTDAIDLLTISRAVYARLIYMYATSKTFLGGASKGTLYNINRPLSHQWQTDAAVRDIVYKINADFTWCVVGIYLTPRATAVLGRAGAVLNLNYDTPQLSPPRLFHFAIRVSNPGGIITFRKNTPDAETKIEDVIRYYGKVFGEPIGAGSAVDRIAQSIKLRRRHEGISPLLTTPATMGILIDYITDTQARYTDHNVDPVSMDALPDKLREAILSDPVLQATNESITSAIYTADRESYEIRADTNVRLTALSDCLDVINRAIQTPPTDSHGADDRSDIKARFSAVQAIINRCRVAKAATLQEPMITDNGDDDNHDGDGKANYGDTMASGADATITQPIQPTYGIIDFPIPHINPRPNMMMDLMKSMKRDILASVERLDTQQRVMSKQIKGMHSRTQNQFRMAHKTLQKSVSNSLAQIQAELNDRINLVEQRTMNVTRSTVKEKNRSSLDARHLKLAVRDMKHELRALNKRGRHYEKRNTSRPSPRSFRYHKPTGAPIEQRVLATEMIDSIDHLSRSMATKLDGLDEKMSTITGSNYHQLNAEIDQLRTAVSNLSPLLSVAEELQTIQRTITPRLLDTISKMPDVTNLLETIDECRETMSDVLNQMSTRHSNIIKDMTNKQADIVDYLNETSSQELRRTAGVLANDIVLPYIQYATDRINDTLKPYAIVPDIEASAQIKSTIRKALIEITSENADLILDTPTSTIPAVSTTTKAQQPTDDVTISVPTPATIPSVTTGLAPPPGFPSSTRSTTPLETTTPTRKPIRATKRRAASSAVASMTGSIDRRRKRMKENILLDELFFEDEHTLSKYDDHMTIDEKESPPERMVQDDDDDDDY